MFYDCDSFPTDKKGDRKDVESDPGNQKPQNRWRCRTSKPKTEYCPETEDRRPPFCRRDFRETWEDAGQEFGNVAGIIQENQAMASNHLPTGFKFS